MKHRGKVKGEQMIILQMNHQPKTKNISEVPRQLFVVSVKINFSQRQTHSIDDQDKLQSVKDTNNEFTECQRPRKMLQSIGILPVSLHTFMKTLKSDILEAYKVQVDCLKDSGFDSYDKNNIKECEWLGQVAQGNARKIKNSIIFRTNPNSYLGT